MVDENENLPSHQNVRGLIQDMTELLDARMVRLRSGTAFAHVRPADAKIFMCIARHPRTISQLARDLGISRQAAHNSVLRLVGHDAVSVESAPDSKRDKMPVLTDKGKEARKTVSENLAVIEREITEKIGEQRLEDFRQTLLDLLATDSPLREKA